ncbi:MAG: hypothetical protein BGO98_04955 [Myxococcales bacterium 68-20]|nr:MAG: hypothetical protein BGO98_04955 [Myxococcales bacterium 68-20]
MAASAVSGSSESGSSFDGMVTGAGGTAFVVFGVTTFGVATAATAGGGSLAMLEMRSSSPLSYELRTPSRATAAGGRTVGGGLGTALDAEADGAADEGGSASGRIATGGGVRAGAGEAGCAEAAGAEAAGAEAGCADVAGVEAACG